MNWPKVTFGRQMILVCSLMLSLILITAVIGHHRFQRIASQARLFRQVRQCHLLFRTINEADTKLTLRFDCGDTRNECAANDWKTAKDKFLAEVKKLSQSPVLGVKEREVVETIQNSWKDYEVSFNRRILAVDDKTKSVETNRCRIEKLFDGLGRITHASLEEEIIGADRSFTLLFICAGILCGISLLIVVHHLRTLRRERHIRTTSNSSELDALKAQADHLRKSLHELTALIGQFLSQKGLVREETPEKEQQENKSS